MPKVPAVKTVTSKRSAVSRAPNPQPPAQEKKVRYRTAGLHDIASRLEHQQIETILDVGANVGHTTLEFADAYPNAAIHAIEPAPAAFSAAVAATAHLDNVTCFEVAFGARTGRGKMKIDGDSTSNRVVSEDRAAGDDVDVDLTTGDEFCADHDIVRVDLLKIDAVGHDLDVLRGFHRMLGEGRISILQVEAGFYPDNGRPVPLERFSRYLEPLGYHVFGIFSPVRSFRGKPVLSRADVIFLSPETITANAAVK